MSDQTTSPTPDKGTSPEFTASHRSVSAGVYRKEIIKDAGSVETLFNVDLRRYYRKENKRLHTHVLGEHDVLFAIKALHECYDYVIAQQRTLRSSKKKD